MNLIMALMANLRVLKTAHSLGYSLSVRYCTRSPGLISLIEVVVVFILVSLWALLLGSVLFNQLVA